MSFMLHLDCILWMSPKTAVIVNIKSWTELALCEFQVNKSFSQWHGFHCIYSDFSKTRLEKMEQKI